MWTYIVIALLLVGLVAYVWIRQVHHTNRAAGTTVSREALLGSSPVAWWK